MNIEKFSLLDEITNISSIQGRITSTISIPQNHSIFSEHFPDNPILPGVLLIEIMAQSAGQLCMYLHDFKKMAMLVKVNEGKFVDSVRPGEFLTCEVEQLKLGKGFSLYRATVKSEDTVKASAEIRLRITPFPSSQANQIFIERFKTLTKNTQIA